MSPRPLAVVFVMPREAGHFHRVRPVIAALAQEAIDVVVVTGERFREHVERVGARHLDLFQRYPLEGLDPETDPPPSQYVTYAATYGDAVAEEVAALDPDVILHDTSAVVGRVVGKALGLPTINVCAGHDRVPARVVPEFLANPRYSISPLCLAAVERLRDEHGIDDATPFSWASGVSPTLNVYCEPPQYLTDEAREAFAPVVCFGSVWDGSRPPAPDPWPARTSGRRRVFVGLGSVAWRVFNPTARALVEAVIDAVAARDDVEALVTTGALGLPESEIAYLARPNVTVAAWVDQWQALAGADVFVTHSGLNSIHEAIYLGVPMVTYPMFGDHPSLSRFLTEHGVAVPLADGVRAPVAAGDVHRALDEIEARRGAMAERLEELRSWEVDVMAERAAVARRIAAIAAEARSARERGQARHRVPERPAGELVRDALAFES